MAGTATVTVSVTEYSVRKYAVAWTADNSGVVSGNDFAIPAGRLLAAHFVPSDESALQPTAAYDVTLINEDGADLLRGLGANLSETTTTFMPALGTNFIAYTPAQTVDLRVANAGNGAAGRVDLFIGP